ncbi:MAG: DJ-1/PfpI family protein, partial [Terasakiella sp.]|nr:DJ-1/PfpI family protein [Terasakiella sp.]
MKKSYIFLAPGFEEVEALATADVMRRAGMEVSVVAVADGTAVTGAHNLKVVADMMLADADLSDADWLVFPGGMPGAQNLHDDATLMDALRAHAARGGRYAAICAAP